MKIKRCAECKKRFGAPHKASKFCSEECREAWQRERGKEYWKRRRETIQRWRESNREYFREQENNDDYKISSLA